MIPLRTTTIAISRPVAGEDPYEGVSAPSTFATGVAAHISAPSGRERAIGGAQEAVELRLTCDPVDLQHTDRVEDELTGELYEVTWASSRTSSPATALSALDHVEAGLRQVSGEASG